MVRIHYGISPAFWIFKFCKKLCFPKFFLFSLVIAIDDGGRLDAIGSLRSSGCLPHG